MKSNDPVFWGMDALEVTIASVSKCQQYRYTPKYTTRRGEGNKEHNMLGYRIYNVGWFWIGVDTHIPTTNFDFIACLVLYNPNHKLVRDMSVKSKVE
jgi:hypothetical protein